MGHQVKFIHLKYIEFLMGLCSVGTRSAVIIRPNVIVYALTDKQFV